MEDYWKKQIEVYNKIEHWGLTLLMGGIGAMTYKLVEWVSALNDGCLRCAPHKVIFGPLAAGIFAMVFLYMVNFRNRLQKLRLHKANNEYPEPEVKPGWLGRLIAIMPLFAGVGGTLLVRWSRFASDTSHCKYDIWLVLGIAALVFLLAEILYRVLYCYWERGTNKDEKPEK